MILNACLGCLSYKNLHRGSGFIVVVKLEQTGKQSSSDSRQKPLYLFVFIPVTDFIPAFFLK